MKYYLLAVPEEHEEYVRNLANTLVAAGTIKEAVIMRWDHGRDAINFYRDPKSTVTGIPSHHPAKDPVGHPVTSCSPEKCGWDSV